MTKNFIFLFLFLSIKLCCGQSSFEKFKERANQKYIQWQKNLGKDISELKKPYKSPYNQKIEIDKSDITTWGLIVGISTYTNMQSLKYADDDAYKIYSFLKSPKGGAVKDEHIKLLIDEDATKANILSNLEYITSKADSNDLIIFYYSGHGLKGSFIPFDYGKQSWKKNKLVQDTTNQIPHEKIASIFTKSKAKHKLCFADACHSGGMFTNKSSASLQAYYRTLEETKGGLALFMSSKKEERSLEYGGVRQGVFSHYLIKGLSGNADKNLDNVVTIAELYDFVSEKVKNYTNYQQNPTIGGAFDPLMPLAIVE